MSAMVLVCVVVVKYPDASQIRQVALVGCNVDLRKPGLAGFDERPGDQPVDGFVHVEAFVALRQKGCQSVSRYGPGVRNHPCPGDLQARCSEKYVSEIPLKRVLM